MRTSGQCRVGVQPDRSSRSRLKTDYTAWDVTRANRSRAMRHHAPVGNAAFSSEGTFSSPHRPTRAFRVGCPPRAQGRNAVTHRIAWFTMASVMTESLLTTAKTGGRGCGMRATGFPPHELRAKRRSTSVYSRDAHDRTKGRQGGTTLGQRGSTRMGRAMDASRGGTARSGSSRPAFTPSGSKVVRWP